MEIGRQERNFSLNNLKVDNNFRRADILSTDEKIQRFRKVFMTSIIAITLLFVISWYILANYTSVVEQIIFNQIADKYGYELSYNNTYSNIDSLNKKQGNYIRLTDKENNIHILFRYSENNNIKIIDDVINNIYKTELYASDIDDSNIQSKEEIIENIDKEFNWLNSGTVSEDSNKLGGGYSLINVGTILNQHNISYESNLLSQNKPSNDKDDNSLELSNIIKYSNSINAKLDILKAIVETESSIEDDAVIIYNGSTSIYDDSDIIDSTSNKTETNRQENSDKINGTLDNFVENKDNIKDKLQNNGNNEQYSTYTELILSTNITADANDSVSNSKDKDAKDLIFNGILFDGLNTTGNTIKNDGIIIGVCTRNNESINKLNKTLDILAIIQFLERTIIL